MRRRSPSALLEETLVIILAGGQGERLYPLTRDRAKPAVPFGGIYRIVDFTLSNCLNSGLRRIYVLTQYKSLSLERHIRLGWDVFNESLDEFITVIPPQQRTVGTWYLGTADAVFQNIYTLERTRPRRVLILAGDHIYKMDYSLMLAQHVETGAGLTVGCVEHPREQCRAFGVAAVDEEHRIVEWREKDPDPPPIPGRPETCLASMGIYVFETDVLVRETSRDARRDSAHDFGRNIVPETVAASRRPGGPRVFAYDFLDENRKEVQYWRDVGSIDAYWEANMDLVAVDPVFNLYDTAWPIRTCHEQMPPAKSVFADEDRRGQALDSLVAGGCIISGGTVVRSILSPGVRIHSYSHVSESVLMEGVKVGRRAQIRRAVIDKGTAVPENEVIGHDLEHDRRRFTVTPGGIVVVPKEYRF